QPKHQLLRLSTKPAARHYSATSHHGHHFSRQTLHAIEETAKHLKAEAEKSQRSAGYQVDHWEMMPLGEVLHETGGKLLCTLPAGADMSWVSEHLADISQIVHHDFSRLTPKQVAIIEERYKNKQHPRGISNYFAGPDSIKHSRLHPGIPGKSHELTYV